MFSETLNTNISEIKSFTLTVFLTLELEIVKIKIEESKFLKFAKRTTTKNHCIR